MKDIKDDDHNKDPIEQTIKRQTLVLPLIELEITNTLQSLYEKIEINSNDKNKKA